MRRDSRLTVFAARRCCRSTGWRRLAGRVRAAGWARDTKWTAIERAAFELEGRAVPVAGAADDLGAAAGFRASLGGRCRAGSAHRDADWRRRGRAQRGRLWFRGPSATSGYYNESGSDRGAVREGAGSTPATARIGPTAKSIITGRAKDIIIKGGRNLYPHEIEELPGAWTGVRKGCVVAFGAPDARSGTERLVVVAEVRDMASASRIEGEITKAVDEAIGMPPDVVKLLAPGSIPKTSSGKLRRNDTRQLFLDGKLGQRRPKAAVQIAALGARSVLPRVGGWIRNAARECGEIVYGVYAICAFAAVLIVTWAALWLTRDAKRSDEILRSGGQWMLKAAGVHVDVKGRETMEEYARTGPWIFAPNHTSYMDVLVVLAHLPAGVRCVAKREVGTMPLVGTIARRNEPIFVRPQRSAGADSASGSGECGAARRDFGCDLPGRHVHGNDGCSAVPAWRVQSSGGYGAADLSRVDSRRPAGAARQNDSASARASDAHVWRIGDAES